MVATIASIVNVCENATQSCGNGSNPLLIRNHTSGNDLMGIVVKLLDDFGRPAFGQPEMELQVQPEPAEGFALSGQLLYAVTGPETNLTNMRMVARVNQVHNLSLMFTPAYVGKMVVQVEVRACVPGEVLGERGDICNVCKGDQYSFDTSNECEPCPPKATCTSSTITPRDGFWHSTSKSKQIHPCILEEACKYGGREMKLSMKAKEVHQFNMSLKFDGNSEYPQCSKVRLQIRHVAHMLFILQLPQNSTNFSMLKMYKMTFALSVESSVC